MSKRPATKIQFGEWLPDLPDLDNPGVVEALNVRPIGRGYKPYFPLLAQSPFIANTAIGGVALLAGGASLLDEVYVGTPAGNLYAGNGGGWNDWAPGGYSGPVTSLAQYNQYVIAANGSVSPVYQQIGAVSAFTTLGTGGVNAPASYVLGVIGQFVMCGNLGPSSPHVVQWSGIGAPLSWPVPNSATAIAQQSGQQTLHAELGDVTGIVGSDQWGLVFQQGGITRVTYIGGSAVFQFDTVSRGIGMDYRNALVKVGNRVFFESTKGFFVTDGTTVQPLGEDKVNRYFFSTFDGNYLQNIRGGIDWQNKLVYWSYARIGDLGVNGGLLIYNWAQSRWAHAADNIAVFATGDERLFSPNTVLSGVLAIGTNRGIGKLNENGTPGVATITTAESEFIPGSRTLYKGFKALVSGSNSITVQNGSRNDQNAAVSLSSAVAPTASTGFSDTFVDARYHRAQVNVTGNFTQLMGGEFDIGPGGTF